MKEAARKSAGASGLLEDEDAMDEDEKVEEDQDAPEVEQGNKQEPIGSRLGDLQWIYAEIPLDL